MVADFSGGKCLVCWAVREELAIDLNDVLAAGVNWKSDSPET